MRVLLVFILISYTKRHLVAILIIQKTKKCHWMYFALIDVFIPLYSTFLSSGKAQDPIHQFWPKPDHLQSDQCAQHQLQIQELFAVLFSNLKAEKDQVQENIMTTVITYTKLFSCSYIFLTRNFACMQNGTADIHNEVYWTLQTHSASYWVHTHAWTMGRRDRTPLWKPYWLG